ncbi:hypothetical protein GCM10010172_35480 [Paractinoplanes ferrugineus]|uniref:Uncharacterized protein n=1 Tax=Paractinoplanes ferrugineus TaxID=113564 RepID=A0A919IYN9_9ACTN|nr:hypothetical protein Afe05nite_09840 [Actinoplanes ferrugineus]
MRRALPTYAQYLATVPFPTYCGFAVFRAFPLPPLPPSPVPPSPLPRSPIPSANAVPAGRHGAKGGPGPIPCPGTGLGAAPDHTGPTTPSSKEAGERVGQLGPQSSRADADGARRDRPARPPIAYHHINLTRR